MTLAAFFGSILVACAPPSARSTTLDPGGGGTKATGAGPPGAETIEAQLGAPTASPATSPEPPVPEAEAGAPTVTAPAANASGERLLYDFSANDMLRWSEPPQSEVDGLLRRFPHPHAAPGAKCDPNRPGTPAAQRMGGVLLPRVTVVSGAFTRAGAAQSAYVIDYCPTGVGVPRTMRLLVLEGEAVELDHELGADVRAEEILHAADVNGDGLSEALLTSSVFRSGRSFTEAVLLQLRPGKPRVLGKWTAIAHCTPPDDERTGQRIFFRVNGGAAKLRAQSVTQRCFYPPSPPTPR